MANQPNPMQGLIIAVAVTLGLCGTAATLFAFGIFERIGLIPTITIVVIDIITVIVFWLLFAYGKLGPRK